MLILEKKVHWKYTKANPINSSLANRYYSNITATPHKVFFTSKVIRSVIVNEKNLKVSQFVIRSHCFICFLMWVSWLAIGGSAVKPPWHLFSDEFTNKKLSGDMSQKSGHREVTMHSPDFAHLRVTIWLHCDVICCLTTMQRWWWPHNVVSKWIRITRCVYCNVTWWLATVTSQ